MRAPLPRSKCILKPQSLRHLPKVPLPVAGSGDTPIIDSLAEWTQDAERQPSGETSCTWHKRETDTTCYCYILYNLQPFHDAFLVVDPRKPPTPPLRLPHRLLNILRLRLWHLNRLENRPTFDQRWRIDETACYGHNPGDMQPFHDLFPLSDTAAATTATKNDDGISPGGDEIGEAKVYYTNEELYAKLSPDEVSMPYMYENFEWTHCEVSLAHSVGFGWRLG